MALTDSPLRFWGSAVAAAVVFSAVVPLVFPYEALRLVTPEDQRRAWLLTVFCGGVMMVLFGMSALLSGPIGGVGIRDVHEAGSVTRAMEAARERRRQTHVGSFATWVVAAGGALVGCYFVLWLTLP
jgi:hypothetical protein